MPAVKQGQNQSLLIGSYGTKSLMINAPMADGKSQSASQFPGAIYAFDFVSGMSEFICQLTLGQLAGLHGYLERIDAIRDHPETRTGSSSQLLQDHHELLHLLSRSEPAQAVMAIRAMVENNFSRDDLNTILGRKDALSAFEARMASPGQHDEPSWQAFFQENDWIFGYGLRYRYLSILQQECHVSSTTLSGRNGVISDFLMSDSRFTKLIELKRPDTPLFKSQKNRADSWCLSSDLTDAISQILAQKANWEIKSQSENFADSGELISAGTCDPDCILIIGTSKEFTGTNLDCRIKGKTIELYRRNLRNVDVVLYDELLERARFIVNGPVTGQLFGQQDSQTD